MCGAVRLGPRSIVGNRQLSANGIDDGLGQIMPTRDVGERIAFGHAQRTPSYLLCLRGV